MPSKKREAKESFPDLQTEIEQILNQDNRLLSMADGFTTTIEHSCPQIFSVFELFANNRYRDFRVHPRKIEHRFQFLPVKYEYDPESTRNKVILILCTEEKGPSRILGFLPVYPADEVAEKNIMQDDRNKQYLPSQYEKFVSLFDEFSGTNGRITISEDNSETLKNLTDHKSVYKENYGTN